MNRLSIIVAVLLLVGCENRTVGWNPANMRCQAFDDGVFHGPFLKNEECAGQPTPEIVAGEPAPLTEGE